MKSKQTRFNNQNLVLNIFFIGLASVAIAIVGYMVIVILFPFFSIQVLGKEDWSLLEGFASVLSLALLIGGLTFAITEYISKENTKQDEKNKLSYDIYKAIFDKLTDPEQEEARRWILANISLKKEEEDIAAWYKQVHEKIMKRGKGSKDDLPEGQRAVKMTLNCFDYIGFIAVHYWDIEDDSLDWISAPIAKVWRRLGPYVEYIRTLRKTTDYYKSAEYVGNLCVNWRQGKGLSDEEYAPNTL